MTNYVWDTGAAVAASGTVTGVGDANRIVLSSIPDYESNRGGDPVRYYTLGVAGYLVGDAYLPPETLSWPEQLLAAPPANATGIYWRLDPNVSGTLYRGVAMSSPIAVACRVYHSQAVNVSNNTPYTLTWDSERNDPYGMHSLVTEPTRITVPEPGFYAVGACVKWSHDANGGRTLDLLRNGAVGIGLVTNLPFPASTTRVFQLINTITWLDAGDYVEAQVVQTSGSTLSLDLQAGSAPEMWVAKI